MDKDIKDVAIVFIFVGMALECLIDSVCIRLRALELTAHGRLLAAMMLLVVAMLWPHIIPLIR